MSAEDEKDDVTAADTPEAKKPAAKKAAKKPAKAAAKAAKGAEAKADDAEATQDKAPAAKKASKKPAAKTEPAASQKKESAKAAAKPPRRRVVRAHARYVRTSARKARMVCGHLRGKSVEEARAILAFTPREVARDWSKLLESAVANAESNHELVEDDLIVREAYADEGPTIKRFRPRAMGRATPIRKRTSHLTIALTTDTAQRTTKRNG
jgi:ribosomal protein L22